MHKRQVVKVSSQLLSMAFVAGLSGCGLFYGKDSYFRDYSVDYVKATETKPLVLPGDLAAEPSKSAMPVPATTGSEQKTIKPNVIPVLQNPVMQAGNITYQIILTSSGTVIESNASRELLWVRMQSFLRAENIPVVSKDDKKGVIETDWVTPSGQTEHGVLYRSYAALFNKAKNEKQQIKLSFNLHPSTQHGIWMITVSAQQRAVGSQSKADWETSNTSLLVTGIKQDFLVYLVEHSGDEVVKGGEGKFNPSTMSSMIKDGNGNPVLKLSASFDTAWNVITGALKKAKVSVEKANHAAGIFYIALPGAESVNLETIKSSGFFERLFGKSNNQDEKTMPVYRLILAPVNDGVYVSLEKNVDTVAPEKLSQVVLEKIKSDL